MPFGLPRLATLLVLTFATSALAPAQNQPTPPDPRVARGGTWVTQSTTAPGLLDISFPGGSIREYYEGLRTHARNANIVIDPAADRVAMSRVEVVAISLRDAVFIPAEMIRGVGPTALSSSDPATGGRETYIINIDTSTAAVVRAMSPHATSPATVSKQFDLHFPGGTIGEYIEAIRKARPGANVILDPGAMDLMMPPADLTGVDLRAAVWAVEGRKADGISVGVDAKPIGDSAEFIYRIDTAGPDGFVRDSRGRWVDRDWGRQTQRIWSLTVPLHKGFRTEDILAAVDASLGLTEGPPPKVQYHAETCLLIVRATGEQADAVNQVINKLYESTPVPPGGPAKGAKQ